VEILTARLALRLQQATTTSSYLKTSLQDIYMLFLRKLRTSFLLRHGWKPRVLRTDGGKEVISTNVEDYLISKLMTNNTKILPNEMSRLFVKECRLCFIIRYGF
jgi:hypothetical protein